MSACQRMRATRCAECGAVQLGDVITEEGRWAPHGATAAGQAARAAHPGPWPTCQHGYPWRADCRNRPVPPVCCALAPHVTTSSDAGVP